MIYLDSAATTLQKPECVSCAVIHAMRTMASVGRGGHRAAAAAARTVYTCREEAARLFELREPEQVVFTFNATHALNIAIRSSVHPGDTVLISGYEHNAVTRTLYMMHDVKVKVVRAPLFEPDEMIRNFSEQMTPDVSTVICTHVSNVFGYILPVDEIAQLCRERGKTFIVDASQSAGCLPVRPAQWAASFVAMPGHKGLYGPQGTGMLLCASSAEPLIVGGTGSDSLNQNMPEFLPDRLEAGTHNVSGIAGLLEGIRFVRKRGIEHIQEHERSLIRFAAERIRNIPGVEAFAQKDDYQHQSNVLSFRFERLDCEEAASLLAEKGFGVRAGLHCAPLAHESVGTLESGTVRISVSYFNRVKELSAFVKTVSQMVI